MALTLFEKMSEALKDPIVQEVLKNPERRAIFGAEEFKHTMELSYSGTFQGGEDIPHGFWANNVCHELNNGQKVIGEDGKPRYKHHGLGNLDNKLVYRMGDYESHSGVVVGQNIPLNLNKIEGREDISQDLKGTLCALASFIYATEAKGSVVTSVQGANPNSFFRKIEMNAILDNPDILNIEILTEDMSNLDKNGHGTVSCSKPIPKKEAYQKLRDGWLDNSIQKYKEAVIEAPKAAKEQEAAVTAEQKAAKEYEQVVTEQKKYTSNPTDTTLKLDNIHKKKVKFAEKSLASAKESLASANKNLISAKETLVSSRHNLAEEYVIAQKMSTSTHPFTQNGLYPEKPELAYGNEDREREVDRLHKIQSAIGKGTDFAKSPEVIKVLNASPGTEMSNVDKVIYAARKLGDTLEPGQKKDFKNFTTQFLDHYEKKKEKEKENESNTIKNLPSDERAKLDAIKAGAADGLGVSPTTLQRSQSGPNIPTSTPTSKRSPSGPSGPGG